MSDKPQLYIGLMSGTSVDGVDVALSEFGEDHCKFVAADCYPFDTNLQSTIHSLSTPLDLMQQPNTYSNNPQENRIEQLAKLDHQLGIVFADAVNQFIKDKSIDRKQIVAIGSHGQTLRHRPTQTFPFSLQIGDPNIIAERTGIVTVADFRRADMAAGGQGAPLVPAFHNQVLRSRKENRVILNLGGIANITYLPCNSEKDILGFDTGPANTLLDANFKRYHNELSFDNKGEFARSGKVDNTILTKLLADPYFQRSAPKSTGREHFNLSWVQTVLDSLNYPVSAESIQATLLELTVHSIVNEINKLNISRYQVYVCGGGVHNLYLLERLSEVLEKPIYKTNQIGVDGDSLEAMTFAWLAYRRITQLPGNLPSATGAHNAKVLGAVYLP